MGIKQYCYSCGHLLDAKLIVSHYNENTGTPQYYEELSCPRRKWYTLGHPLTSCEAYVMYP